MAASPKHHNTRNEHPSKGELTLTLLVVTRSNLMMKNRFTKYQRAKA